VSLPWPLVEAAEALIEEALAPLAADLAGSIEAMGDIHVAPLPFGVALLASARIATGEARALRVRVLAASAVMQCQIAWIAGVTLPAVAGFVLLVWPAARRALRIPTCGQGVTPGTSAAAVLGSRDGDARGAFDVAGRRDHRHTDRDRPHHRAAEVREVQRDRPLPASRGHVTVPP
jgi:hypothetical protein